MFKLRPEDLTDFYKTGHINQYPPGTQFVYSNWTCRSDKLMTTLPDFDHKAVFFGLQAVIRYLLIDLWDKEFFELPRGVVVKRFQRRMDLALGPNAVDAEKSFGALHDLGYLPLLIKAVPEGSRVNMRVPMMTFQNTHPDFYWVTNFFESMVSAEMWKMITTATTAYEYRRLLDQYAEKTGSDKAFVLWQAHDFSFRGQDGVIAAIKSGAAHLLSFTGTDTVPALDFIEDFYSGADTFIGGSVPATEHSVMCMGGCDGEIETFDRLITETYPAGVVSIVSDTWDFWQVITVFAAQLKDKIMAREGKVVFRPDSGDPVKIICGAAWPLIFDGVFEDHYLPDLLDEPWREGFEYVVHANRYYKVTRQDGYEGHYTFELAEVDGGLELAGAVECLWTIFGGTMTTTGHLLLDSHVGLIYGDSITLKRAQLILKLLEMKGFASGNVVFGVGSFTYQFVTRDNLGQAIKATFGTVNSEDRELFKDPKTDVGSMKRSAKGLLRVEKEGDDFVLYDQQTREQEADGALLIVFANSKAFNLQTFEGIRKVLHGA